MLKKILFGGSSQGSVASGAGLSLLRIFAGISLMLGHGIGKVPPSDKFVSITANLGFPLPQLFAWAAGLAEFAGGALLALGLFTRVSSFFVAFTMFTAAFIAEYGKGFGEQEKALLYMFIAILFLLKGAGEWSIDGFIREKLKEDE